ncbi:hypothetical protein [Falsiphaeobacter marinintestinus]|uniref:hypothetical protein n=1 Tax=Falsiphaeobacter marinintestinus TaxID=1492905 RepID=UPI001FE9048F|nr:hypothetical protein [Phaeobacter marinintestinus]
MIKLAKLSLLPLLLGFGACTATPEAQHEVACVGGTLAGAVIGAAIGNQFGGGRGNTIMTAAGAGTGAVTAATSMNCVR